MLSMRGSLSGSGMGSSLGAATRNTSGDLAMEVPSVEAMDYASSIRMLAVVLSDGACALLKAAESGLAPADQLQFMHWVCRSNSGALAVRIGVTHCCCCHNVPVCQEECESSMTRQAK
jgi:hypothetical protein